MAADLFSLAGKTAVVTGSSRGLGLYAAHGLLAAGVSTLFITSRNASACSAALTELQASFPSATLISIPADLSKSSEVLRLVAEIKQHVSAVHILIANAGATWGAPFDTHPDAAIDKVFALNVRAVFALIRDLCPLLEAAATADDPARVVAVGSVAGIAVGATGEMGTYGYSASKAAVHHLVRNLAVELGPRGVLVNAVAPGFFITKMAKEMVQAAGGEEKMARESPNGRLGREEDIKGVLTFLCSKAAGHVNGVVVPLDGGKHLAVSRL
ncbi:hypothetical protein EDC01DRAFT_663606 [Geopyxis carbonaria]|nr:hypothetical protein EDC01DRAFT_663606 [Geopyxis carbonaria]